MIHIAVFAYQASATRGTIIFNIYSLCSALSLHTMYLPSDGCILKTTGNFE